MFHKTVKKVERQPSEEKTQAGRTSDEAPASRMRTGRLRLDDEDTDH